MATADSNSDKIHKKEVRCSNNMSCKDCQKLAKKFGKEKVRLAVASLGQKSSADDIRNYLKKSN